MDDTFVGVPLGEETTLFYRVTTSGTEGFVVDNLALVQALKQRVLEERGLAELVDVTSLRAPEAGLSGGFNHSFAEPFSEVTAHLRLTPLEAPWFEQLLIPLALLVALLLVLGLWALYRVVATNLEFAQRQNNFVSAVTHELKTPLTAIRMHSEMLQEGLVDGPQKAQEYYATITSQTERLTRLIENVLLFSQVDKGRSAVGQYDLVVLVRKVAQTLGPQLERSGFSLHLELPERSTLATYNEDHLEQILFNLVENSIKYAATATDRRITIAVDTAPALTTLSVRDRGPGVSESLLNKVFEPFFRAEDEMTRKHQGSGLGLALVRGLALQMGARVMAEVAKPGFKVLIELRRVSPS